MGKMQKKSFLEPDNARTFKKGKVELVTIGTVTFGRATFQAGWKWSDSVQPLVNTKSCVAPHLQYHISGRLHVVMDDGSEEEFVAGNVSLVPPGHNAWVVGDEPVIVVDITGMENYAKKD